jgi:hypothetical protein
MPPPPHLRPGRNWFWRTFTEEQVAEWMLRAVVTALLVLGALALWRWVR